MSKLRAWWAAYKGTAIAGALATVIATVALNAFGVIGYVAKAIYDAPFEVKDVKRDLIEALGNTERALSKKLDDQSKKLDDQSKQLEAGKKDIQSIKQALITLILNSNVKTEDKEKILQQLSALIDPPVITATTDFARGKYAGAYSKLFELSAQGNADARSALFSASDVLYGKINARRATDKEQQAFWAAMKNARQLGITDFVRRYEEDSPTIRLFRQPRASTPEPEAAKPKPSEGAAGDVQRRIEDAMKDREIPAGRQ